jgi:hypothetical protein
VTVFERCGVDLLDERVDPSPGSQMADEDGSGQVRSCAAANDKPFLESREHVRAASGIQVTKAVVVAKEPARPCRAGSRRTAVSGR